ncbi:hypothetical protein [Sinanaerobacter chloroacetimidivorans]|uniref:Uncharacterized protein n=1 Tax=Sinanaerobacter chloroacetimidivorans TaxID=2818044 RepID=A0A8J7VYM7_9FIRM|nr:hypothetical protein [Sinanaerobacter chloroacetimidivorans]MBR0596443.1 hypothetical protein [Sinanaerobacter chloroacetimidivorans]
MGASENEEQVMTFMSETTVTGRVECHPVCHRPCDMKVSKEGGTHCEYKKR